MRRDSRSACHADNDTPLSLLLFRYLWPFWLFEDATRGDLLTRAAAYRHNRSMRIHLPGYLLRWSFGCAAALAITSGFGSLSTAEGAARSLDIFAIIAAGWGVIFACSVCVLLVMAYIYLYLKHND